MREGQRFEGSKVRMFSPLSTSRTPNLQTLELSNLPTFIMYWTLDRLLLVAVVITLISLDGVYRAWKQWKEERIGHRLFMTYAVALSFGSGLAWFGFLVEWLE